VSVTESEFYQIVIALMSNLLGKNAAYQYGGKNKRKTNFG